MMMEHNFYKEAIADVRLSDEEGMEMVENAIERRERQNRKRRVQVFVLTGILVLAFGANGICYAQTGQNIWELFRSTMYQNNQNEEITAIAENSRISGETIEDGNRRYTLEYYWYDPENGEAYFAIRTDSLDKTPLQTDAEDYVLSPISENYGTLSFDQSTPVLSEDQTSVWRYYHMMFAYSYKGKKSDEIAIELEVADGGPDEDGYITYRQLGSFALEPTGGIKICYADGSSVLEGCQEIRITGAGIAMSLDRNLDLEQRMQNSQNTNVTPNPRMEPERTEENPRNTNSTPNPRMESAQTEEIPRITDTTPFHFIEIKMEDGSVYHVLGALPEGDEMIWDENTGLGVGYIHQGETVTGESYLGAVTYSGGFNGWSKSGWESMFTTTFTNFIDVDNIAGVYLDGVELPLVTE